MPSGGPARSTLSRVLRTCATLALVGGACAVGASVVQACTLANCNGQFIVIDGRSPVDANDKTPHEPVQSTASMLDDSTWQSSPLTGPWHPFPGQFTYEFWPNLPPDGRGPMLSGYPSEVLVYLGVDEVPNDTGNFTLASGNIAEIGFLTQGGSVRVHNDSCADYYIRVVIHAQPVATTPAADAGASTMGDASSDGPLVDVAPAEAAATDASSSAAPRDAVPLADAARP